MRGSVITRFFIQVEKRSAERTFDREFGGRSDNSYPHFRAGDIGELRRQVVRGDKILPAHGNQGNGYQGLAFAALYGFLDKDILPVTELDKTIAVRGIH